MKLAPALSALVVSTVAVGAEPEDDLRDLPQNAAIESACATATPEKAIQAVVASRVTA